MELDHDGVRVRFFTPNKTTKWRVDSLLTKEPDTIEWIRRLSADDVLYDIGANVGMYSVLAAATRGTRVYAFEPESQNYAILNTNILINALQDRITAYCMALADRFAMDELYLSSFDPGGSLHNFGEARDYQGRELHSRFRQGSIGMTLDKLVAEMGLAAPTHIKIDVDGIEDKIVAGAKRVLADRRLRSLIIEINTNLEGHWDIIDLLLEHGFSYEQDQVERAQRNDGPFKGIGNYVFRR
jgi:FkbM family methyltransferase